MCIRDSIEGSAFQGCTHLTSVTIGTGVTNIGELAFDGCISLTSITLPPSVTSIGQGAFDGCYGLTSVTIPGSVASIGRQVFEGCTSVTNVTIGTGVTNIGNSAFANCVGLAKVYFQGNSPTPTNDLTVFSGDSHGVVYYLPATTGWGTMFDGLPTMLLISSSAPFSISGGSVGVGAGGFGFTITGTNNEIVIVEASTNLTNWRPIQTLSLIHISEPTRQAEISYAVFCLKK